MPIQRKKSESEISQEDENSDYLNLSSRECEVLNHLSRGACNQDMAVSLGVTLSTVEKHLTNIYKKLGVKSRTEAVLWRVKKGGDFRN